MVNNNPEIIKRFVEKIEQKNNCWVWTASKFWNGYGGFRYHGKTIKAHRFSYELFKGEIPKGMDLDHLCRNRACVNPDHLEAVTRSVNLLRGLAGKVNNPQTKKTHCPRGHELKEPNLDKWQLTRGKRSCRICRNESQQKYLRKLKVINL